MNYFDLVKAVCKSPGITINPPKVFNTSNQLIDQIKFCINNANIHICDSREWDFKNKKTLLNTVVGQNEYAYPGFVKMDGIRIKSDSGEYVPLNYNDSIKNKANSTGTPQEYCINGENVLIYPTPDSVKELKFEFYTYGRAENSGVYKSNLEIEEDKSIIPESFHDLIALKAVLLFIANPLKKYYPHYVELYRIRYIDLLKYDQGSQDNENKFVIG